MDNEIKATEIDDLLTQAERALASVDVAVSGGHRQTATPLQLRDFADRAAVGEPAGGPHRDTQLDLRVDLGRRLTGPEELLKLRKGSVVTLDKREGDPVDVLAQGRLIARGQVLVLGGRFGVRVTELIGREQGA